MKVEVDCPGCGMTGQFLQLNPETQSIFCRRCGRWYTESELLRHMRDKPGMDRYAPAFRRLDIKAKGKSEAARLAFG